MGLPRLLDADGSLSRFPRRNLVRQKALVQGAILQGDRGLSSNVVAPHSRPTG